MTFRKLMLTASLVIAPVLLVAQNPAPGTRNLEPGTRNLEPGTRNLEP